MIKKQIKKNEGIITIPFLLVLVIILFFTLSFFMLAMTLAHVTVTQYITYSSARKLSLAGETKQIQLEEAILHYKNLRDNFFESSAHKGEQGDWFFIQSELEDFEQQYSIQGDYPRDTFGRKRFYGVNTSFQTLALNLKIPFLLDSDDDQINEPVRISSFLGREVSKTECKEFHKARVEKIKDIAELENQCNNQLCPDLKAPIELEGDNGC
ncbi:MAG: hypothetical protein OXC37_02205 [Bdellovibrionaceae bacterium]|nr:hypothetical protein [Pseudobdellovibrionaceae bacterium]